MLPYNARSAQLHGLNDLGRIGKDCICCVIMLAYWVWCVGLYGYAVVNGDYEVLLRPQDSRGRSCGLDNSKGQG